MNPDNPYFDAAIHLLEDTETPTIADFAAVAQVRENQRQADALERLATAWEKRVALAEATAKAKGVIE